MMKYLRIGVAALMISAAGLAVSATLNPAFAAKPEIYTRSGDIALGGYDAVSFFAKAPVKGVAGFQTTYKGATFQFANAENLAKFKAAPDKFAPQYGGYCAWAASQGKTAPADPRYYRIVNGKLYLNFDAGVQQRWEKDIPGFITKADANWPKIIQ